MVRTLLEGEGGLFRYISYIIVVRTLLEDELHYSGYNIVGMGRVTL